jgi:hypothetical protein
MRTIFMTIALVMSFNLSAAQAGSLSVLARSLSKNVTKESLKVDAVYAEMRTSLTKSAEVANKEGYSVMKTAFIDDAQSGLKIESVVKDADLRFAARNGRRRYFVELNLDYISTAKRQKIEELVFQNKSWLDQKQSYKFGAPSAIQMSTLDQPQNSARLITIEPIREDSSYMKGLAKLLTEVQDVAAQKTPVVANLSRSAARGGR